MLHVNSAEEARLRLLDRGGDAVLRGVLAQRLEIMRCGICSGTGCETCAECGVTERRLRMDLWVANR